MSNTNNNDTPNTPSSVDSDKTRSTGDELDEILEHFEVIVCDDIKCAIHNQHEKCIAETKEQAKKMIHRYAQKMVVAELKELETLPNIYPEEIDGEPTHVQAIYKSALTNRIDNIERELENNHVK